MRKFFAFILAIIFAFLVVTAAMFWQKGVDFSKVNFEKVQEVWTGLFTIEVDDNTDVKVTEVNVPEVEENLSYSERIEKGDYYFDRGFLTFASNEYVKAANLEPNRIEPYLRLIKTNYELGDYGKAQNNAEIVLKMNPGDFNTQFDLSLIYIKQSDFLNAQAILKQLDSSEISDPRVTYYLGLLEITFNNHVNGKKFLKQALADSQDPALDDKIGILLDSYTEYEFAQAADELYLAELLARSFNKTGEYEMAVHKLKTILKTRSDLRDAWILFGFAYLNLEKYYFALSAFERAYELDSEWPTTQYFLGLTHVELGNTDDAIIYLSYALANNFQPEIVIHQKLADLYLEVQDYTKAVSSYESVLNLNDEDINTFVRPIWIYLDFLNQPVQALEIAELAATAFPENAMSYNLLGWSQIGTGDYKESEENLKKAIELNPNLPVAYFNLGKLYEMQNRNSKALEAYQRAYELDQNGSIGNMAAKAYNALSTE